MEEQTPKYRSEFLRSPHHAVFGLLTLGLGFLSAELLPLIAGATVYALGWIYLPDLNGLCTRMDLPSGPELFPPLGRPTE
jgi:hypothetical protein